MSAAVPPELDAQARRSRLIGRLIVTGVLLVAVLGGLVVLHFGKRLAAQRTSRFAPATAQP